MADVALLTDDVDVASIVQRILGGRAGLIRRDHVAAYCHPLAPGRDLFIIDADMADATALVERLTVTEGTMKTPVIVLTAGPAPEVTRRMQRCGALLIDKSTLHEELADRVEAALTPTS